LALKLHSLVRRILFDNATKTATGVEFSTADGKLHTVRARKEVIVSAGSIESPKLLLLSGIGPSREITPLGIKAIANLPGVGKNLQDHISVPTIYDVRSDLLSLEHEETLANIALYLFAGTGPLSSNIAELNAYVKTKNGTASGDPYYLQLVCGAVYYLNHGFEPRGDRGNSLACLHVLSYPKSKGELVLNPNDVHGKPLIDPNYFDSAEDFQAMCAGCAFVRDVFQTKEVQQTGAKMIIPKSADEDVREFVKNRASTLYHPVGTCKMGSSDDEMAVVDPALKVRGIKGLRVIDASVMPHITGTNTNVPTLMIAEKGASLILQEHKA